MCRASKTRLQLRDVARQRIQHEKTESNAQPLPTSDVSAHQRALPALMGSNTAINTRAQTKRERKPAHVAVSVHQLARLSQPHTSDAGRMPSVERMGGQPVPTVPWSFWVSARLLLAESATFNNELSFFSVFLPFIFPLFFLCFSSSFLCFSLCFLFLAAFFLFFFFLYSFLSFSFIF